MNVRGRAWKFGDDVNTDEIIPARFLNTSDPDELAGHCMEDADPDFVKKAARGDIIVGGTNFGCGSSREHAPVAIKAAGISCVIAASFARIFYRNSINIGLPIVESAEAAGDIQAGDVVEVNLEKGRIENKTKGRTYMARSFPKFMQDLIREGGLMNKVKSELAKGLNRGE